MPELHPGFHAPPSPPKGVQGKDPVDRFARSFPVQLPDGFVAEKLFLEAEYREAVERGNEVADISYDGSGEQA